jgi:hypothetical protein
VIAPNAPFHAFRSQGVEFEQLLAVTIPEQALTNIGLVHQGMRLSKTETLMSAGGILGWLMRAWNEKELVYKFLALFIPLEMVLNNVSLKSLPEIRQQTRAIRSLINRHGGESKGQLLAFFNDMAQGLRPPLSARFEVLAQAARMPGWQLDIEAFKRFNSMRNALVHRGDRHIKLAITSDSPDENDVQTLEDLAERYVSYALFGDAMVYSNPWRPERRHGLQED